MPDEVLVLRACEIYGITPDQADGIDRDRIMEHLTIRAIESAIRQSETKASQMTPDQVDLIAGIRRLKSEQELDD